jgi:hypothetical protein
MGEADQAETSSRLQHPVGLLHHNFNVLRRQEVEDIVRDKAVKS